MRYPPTEQEPKVILAMKENAQTIDERFQTIKSMLKDIERPSETILSALHIMEGTYTSFAKWKWSAKNLHALKHGKKKRPAEEKTDKWSEIHDFVDRMYQLKKDAFESGMRYPAGGLAPILVRTRDHLGMLDKDIIEFQKKDESERNMAVLDRRVASDVLYICSLVRDTVDHHALASKMLMEILEDRTAERLRPGVRTC